jgi:hypothetical protein
MSATQLATLDELIEVLYSDHDAASLSRCTQPIRATRDSQPGSRAEGDKSILSRKLAADAAVEVTDAVGGSALGAEVGRIEACCPQTPPDDSARASRSVPKLRELSLRPFPIYALLPERLATVEPVDEGSLMPNPVQQDRQ